METFMLMWSSVYILECLHVHLELFGWDVNGLGVYMLNQNKCVQYLSVGGVKSLPL